MIVVDTNVVVSLLMEESIKQKELFQNNYIVAPEFLKLEVLNILRKFHVIEKIPIEVIDISYNSFLAVVDEFVDDKILLQDARNISFSLNHPIYDCLFLALANIKGTRFASFDKRLTEKAKGLGLLIYPFV